MSNFRLLANIVVVMSMGPGVVSCVSEGGDISKDAAPPTLLLHGGKIWTGAPEAREVTAIAVQGDRIVAVGNDETVLALAVPDTRLIDLRGRRAVPGFIDSHVHFEGGGEELLAPDLRTARSEEDFARRVGEFARTMPAGTWVTSGAWDHENWPGGKEPTRAILDAYTPDHPVLVSRLDGHMAIANTRALEIAGISRDTPDPPGGAIVHDPKTGEPTGLLRDAAMGLVSRHAPAPGLPVRLERVRAALRHAAELGVTGVHDMQGGGSAAPLYERLRKRGELTLRVSLYDPIATHNRPLSPRSGRDQREGDLMIRTNGYKGFADGSLGSSTALFFEPYRGDPDNRGLALTDLAPGGVLERQVSAITRNHEQVAIHGIGDRAISALLDIYMRVGKKDVSRHRFRIEHSQHIRPADLGRFGAHGVIASMQPYHAVDDGRWAAKRLDEKRLETTYAFRDLLDSKATLAFGSDWPVASLSPILGIHAAVTRATLDGLNPGGWIPRQKITVEEALRAYTAGSAYAGFAENEVGTLAPGKLADIVVLDRDLFTIEPEAIPSTRVDMTILGGKVVYEREGENP